MAVTSDTMADRQSTEAAEAGERRDSMMRILLLSLGLLVVAGSYLFVPPEWTDTVVLVCLGVLSTVGVMCLFMAAGGLIRFVRSRVIDTRVPGLPEQLFEAIGEGALIADSAAGAIKANRAYYRLYGEESGDLRSIERLFAESPDASEAIYRLSGAAEKGRRAMEEIRMPGGIGGQAGSARWYRVKVNPIAGRSELALWLISDITREREHQENIFQELQNAIDYLDHAPAGFFSMQPDGRIRYVNATLAEWLGIDLADFEPGAAEIGDFVTAESLSVLEASGQRGETATERLEIDLVRANGTRKPVRLLHRVPVSADGTVGASRTLVLEVGLADGDAGLAAERRFTRFFNNTPMAIASVDHSGAINLSNARFLKLFRKSGPARIELTSVVKAADRPALKAALHAAINGQSDISPVDAQFESDEERSARFFVSPIVEGEPGEDAAIVYALETTEQRALEAQFAQSQKMQAVGQLAGGIAHDFNNVLTAIIGFSDLLLSNHRPSDPAFEDIMNIKQNANRAAGLVRQLLAFSRRQTLQPRVIRLDEVLSDLTVLLDRLLGETVELKTDHKSGLWPVKADLNQLEQVVVNLAVNARDAMPSGGTLTIRASNLAEDESHRFRQDGFRPADYVLIEITDTGTGMPPEVMEKIFEPFFSTKEIGKGTGLGLSTVYGIIKQTDGFIFVDSELGKGTTFSLLLPRYVAEREAEEEVASPKSEPTDLTGSATILLVEDEEAVRAFASRALAARGYEVHEAASGPEALRIMKDMDGAIDLVVSDVVMPEMDGPTLLKELRKTNPALKIIFVSGYAEDAFARHLPENEDFHFLPKPFSLKDLAITVKRVLQP
ncbi:cell cycle histidine kinase CckA [Afifella marina]|uniref:histidine kinase n=3 Tax=Hyphomicrobiales TaxID=356 RepID=A0A1G5N883_AFIMA|nr:two-component system, cell cycle sensor histidine kinase and response regulator CckA [Afifella marina DSM 2698]